ncbi:MAG: DNA recombination protein RmuC [Bacteroidota bacterium]
MVLIICGLLLIANCVLLFLIYTRLSRIGSQDKTENLILSLKESGERTERLLLAELAKNRGEMSNSIKDFTDSLLSRTSEIAGLQKNQLDTFSSQLTNLTQTNEQKFETLRQAVESRLKIIQDDNSAKLEQIRSTVDEKLHATLEQRLGESFKQVSERLEQVQRGLGEMQSLASGVGDLKKVLTNVKTRGTWGEIQLGNLLEQVLTAEQYARNIATKPGSNDRVEFAIKLPGRNAANGENVWLPIDAKFPREDYEKLIEAQELADPVLADEAGKNLENRVKLEAKSIKEKYLDPPHTTDFGIMYLPTEGLYAEVLRRNALCDIIQREHRVLITGPTTLTALLNSLQMGFRTLAIEKRSSEVWTLLATVKTEFGRFGDVLDKTQKKLQEASNTIESAATRSRAIERKLKEVQASPVQNPPELYEPSKTEISDDPTV